CLLAGIAGAVGGVVHLPHRAAHGDRIGTTVAAPVDQLVADVGDDVAVLVLVALGAVGHDADAGVLVADVALGHVAAGLGVEAQLVGAQELVAADQGHVALVLGGGLGAAEFVALDVGGLLVAGLGDGRIRRRRLAERRQHVAHRAQPPVQRLLVGHGGQA